MIRAALVTLRLIMGTSGVCLVTGAETMTICFAIRLPPSRRPERRNQATSERSWA